MLKESESAFGGVMVMLMSPEAGAWSGLSAQLETGVHLAFKMMSLVIGVWKSISVSRSDQPSNR